MTVTDATTIWNNTGLISLVFNMDTASGQAMIFGVLIAIFAIGMIIFTGYDVESRLLVSSLLSLLCYLLLWYAGIAPSAWMGAFFALFVLALLYRIFT